MVRCRENAQQTELTTGFKDILAASKSHFQREDILSRHRGEETCTQHFPRDQEPRNPEQIYLSLINFMLNLRCDWMGNILSTTNEANI
jgi:hypothetical protein